MGFSLKKAVSSLGGVAGAVGGAVIGGPAGAALGYELGNSVGGMFQQDLAEDYTKQAWDRQLQMWNMNNSYNDPSAQMARLKAAGLNPNLVYGSGNVVGNTSSGGYGNFETSTIGNRGENAILAYQRLLSNDATIRNIESEISQRMASIANEQDLTRARVKLMNSQSKNQDLNSSLLGYDVKFYNDIDSLFGESGKAATSTGGKIVDFIARGGLRGLAGAFRR